MSQSKTPTWTKPAEVKARLRRRWERGDLLSDSLTGSTLFPLRIPIRNPTSGEITGDYSVVRDWIASWRGQNAITCEYTNFNHRLFGANEMPTAAIFPDAQSATQLLGVRREWETFHRITERILTSFPELIHWLVKRPMLALELEPQWDRLIAVLTWVRNHPHSGCYVRQIDLPGVHTKFVERNRGTLTELLDLVLPQDAINFQIRGNNGFNRRYGFRDKPERIRIRFLDHACAIEPHRLGLDLTLDAAAFSKLHPPVERVFITENETNFLAFPDHPKSLVIFGAGYGWSSLAGADWLSHCAIHYWGDIDSHGFAILDQLRIYFPHVQSLLMDKGTLEFLHEFWVDEPDPLKRELQRLTSAEKATFDFLRSRMNPKSLRLEQERVPYTMLQTALQNLDDHGINALKSDAFPDAIQNESGQV